VVAPVPPSTVGFVRPLGAERARAGEAVPDRHPRGVCGAGERRGVKAERTCVGEQPGGCVPEQDLCGQQIRQGGRIVRRVLLAGEEPELGVDRQCPPGSGDHFAPVASTRRGLGPRPGHLPVVEQLEERVELLVGLERPILDRTIGQVAACPAVRAAVAADPQPAEMLGNHGEGAWLDVPGGEQEECLVVRVAGPGQLEQPVVGEDAALAGSHGECRAAEDVVQHAADPPDRLHLRVRSARRPR
jgi:hypothetical protein